MRGDTARQPGRAKDMAAIISMTQGATCRSEWNFDSCTVGCAWNRLQDGTPVSRCSRGAASTARKMLAWQPCPWSDLIAQSRVLGGRGMQPVWNEATNRPLSARRFGGSARIVSQALWDGLWVAFWTAQPSQYWSGLVRRAARCGMLPETRKHGECIYAARRGSCGAEDPPCCRPTLSLRRFCAT
jgi:hypothetical protein